MKRITKIGIVVLSVAAACAAACQKSASNGQPGNQTAPSAGPEMGPGARPGARVAREPETRRASPRLVKLWAAGGLRVPESVQWDAARKVLYVSNIDGKPTDKDGKGFLSKLSPEGKVLVLEWVGGMNAPKGMGLAGDTLWVTDIDRLHAVDIAAGKIVRTVEVPEAKFLNDIAIGPKGEVFVSDMTRGTVHVLRDGKLPVLADLSAHKGSNGMLMEGGQLLVGTATGIVRVDPETGKAEVHVPVSGFGMIDGLKAYGGGAYVVSNWAGRTQIVRAGAAPKLLLDTTAMKIQSADLEYVAATRTLYIPTFFDNHVVAYRVER